MDYFSILQLEKEPFSNSPDPAFFFKSRQHQDCLQKIELALRLKRGLNIVMGDVGTGKTTLCRQLIRRFQGDEKVDTHLILDPGFDTPEEFLVTVAEMLTENSMATRTDTWQLKEEIKNNLYKRGIDDGRTIVLIFDEGQKLPPFAIELLREFLNYETNTEKLLQIAIFAQREFEAVLAEHANFTDRVNLLHRLEPMSFRDTREMIRFRLRKSSASPKPLPLFTYPAMWAIYRFSKGYPRKIIHLCHQSLLAMIIQNRTKAGLMLVRSSVRRAISHPGRRLWRPLTTCLLLLLVVVVIAVLLPEPYTPLSHLASRWRSRPWVSVYRVGDPEESRAAIQTPDKANTQDSIQPSPNPASRSLKNDQSDELASAKPALPAAKPPMEDSAYMDEPMAVSPPDLLLPAVIPPSGSPNPADGDGTALSEKKSVKAPPPPRQGLKNPFEKGGTSPSQAPGTGASKTVSGDHHPLLLGRLEVAPGDTIVQLVRQVRGNYDPQYIGNLMALNPHIHNPDSIAINDNITFPATPVKVSPLIHRTHWLQLSESTSLSQAHQALNAFGTKGLSVHLVPYWTAQTGLRFVVVVAEAFASPQAVRHRMKTLPPDVAPQSRVRSKWGHDPVFFASPF